MEVPRGPISILTTRSALADKCRALREDAGLSRAELAEAMGEHSVVVHQAESDNPSRMAARRRVLAHFGLRFSEGFILEPA